MVRWVQALDLTLAERFDVWGHWLAVYSLLYVKHMHTYTHVRKRLASPPIVQHMSRLSSIVFEVGECSLCSAFGPDVAECVDVFVHWAICAYLPRSSSIGLHVAECIDVCAAVDHALQNGSKSLGIGP